MSSQLAISLGQYSAAGPKPSNQDFYGAIIPEKGALALKGIALTIADGISSSPVGHIASQTAVGSFLSDYYSTPEAWTVKKAASRVIAATNAWLYAETKRSQEIDPDRGFVTTFSSLVFKARQAHLFHVGDSRIYRLSGGKLEQLTTDHRVILNSKQNYLGRALGMAPNVEIDYNTLPVALGDVFIMMTDGVHEFVKKPFLPGLIQDNIENLEKAAQSIVWTALENGADDNVTVQIARVDTLPEDEDLRVISASGLKPLKHIPEVGDQVDEWKVIADVSRSSRSHVFKVEDVNTGKTAIMKVPSVDIREQEDALQRLLMEEWIAKRLTNQHLVKTVEQKTPKTALYIVLEYVEAETLNTWIAKNPNPNIEQVRSIIVQIAAALQAMHRKQMIHQDLRPHNVMIDKAGHITLIDYGAAYVAGIQEAKAYKTPNSILEPVLGTFQFAAPEYFIGEPGASQSDIYSIGVIAYQMLTGQLPYGSGMARARSLSQQKRIRYIPIENTENSIPGFVDAAIRKAVNPDPLKRYDELSEFIADLHTPNTSLPHYGKQPLIEKNTLLFWQVLSLGLFLMVIFLLAQP
jgi:serine/threonine protein phosphatase PrpC